MKDNTEQVHAQVPVDGCRLSAQREAYSIANLEQRNDVRVYIIPNQHLETPHYEVTRIRRQDPGSGQLRAQTEIAKPVLPAAPGSGIEREQPLLQGFAQLGLSRLRPPPRQPVATPARLQNPSASLAAGQGHSGLFSQRCSPPR